MKLSKQTFTGFLFLFFMLVLSSGYTQAPVPELLYYNFNGSGTSVPNLASSPPSGTAVATIQGGLTQGGTDGACGTGGLIGNGLNSNTNRLNTGWATNLTGTSWTISFRSSNINNTSSLWYIFGDPNATGFRCFTNGVAGPNNWILRGPIGDISIPGGATLAPHVNTFVYDAVAGQTRAYLDGTLVSTVTQSPPTISTAGPFTVGAYSSNNGLNPGGVMDNFRLYNRALTPAEILLLNNAGLDINSVTANTPLCPGVSLNLNVSAPGATGYLWSGAGTFSDNTLPNPVVTGATTSRYYVTASTSACSTTDSVDVTVTPLALAITPDASDSTLAHSLITNCVPNYTLYWKRVVAGASWSSMSGSGNTPDIMGLLPATAYLAYAMDANGATSPLVYFTTSGTPVCGAAPSGLTASVNCGQITASWNASGYTSFTSYIRKITPTPGASNAAVTTSTTRTLTVPTNSYGEQYEISVSGKCGTQYSVYSNPVFISAPDPRPAAPSPSFSATCSSITTTWSAVPGAVGYFVRIKNPNNNTTFVNFYTTGTSYTKTGMNPNFTYEVFVIPVGCNNLQGTHSIHYLVQTCSGNVSTTTTRTESEASENDLSESSFDTDFANATVYPNPNNGNFMVSAFNQTESASLIEVINIMGQVVYTVEVPAQDGTIKQEILLPEENTGGTYLIKITNGKNTAFTKFVKMH